MKIKITYPELTKKQSSRRRLIKILRWPMLAAAVACPVVNYIIGGKAWSVIVLMGLYMAWTLAVKSDLVEYNAMSQFTKFAVMSCILLILIDWLLAPGWAILVVPLVCVAATAVCAALLFSDLETQRQNMLPMLLFIFACIAGCIIGIWLFPDNPYSWAMKVMGAAAGTLLIACFITLRMDFIEELKRRFHVK